LAPDLSREHSRLLFRGRNVHEHKTKIGCDVDSHRIDVIQNSVVGSLGYPNAFRDVTRGSELVMDDESEGTRWKAVMTNLNELVGLRTLKKDLGECNSCDLPAEI
jgi:hypothetical protein